MSRIVCAAAMADDGTVIISPRHFDSIFYKMYDRLITINKKLIDTEWVEGFIDQHGNFFDREEAFTIAMRNNQIIKNIVTSKPNELNSEHLY